MSRDPWIQRFDERADEDDRYARRLEQERAERDAEKCDEIAAARWIEALEAATAPDCGLCMDTYGGDNPDGSCEACGKKPKPGILSVVSSNISDGGMTIEEFERAVKEGLRGFRGPKTLPPDVVRAMEALPPGPLEPPQPPDRSYGPCGPHESKAFIALGWLIGGIIALVLALAIATAIFMGVAWALGPGS